MSAKVIAGLLLTPGAGADRHQPTLVALDEALRKFGIVVRRMDFPYRKEGRRAPDRAPKLIESIREELASFISKEKLAKKPVFIGGRSMGGRMCSMAVAEGLDVDGLVLISYPLHPPGKPENLRVEHFPEVKVPCLLISGTRDAFGSPDELRKYAKRIKGKTELHFLEGGDHGLRKFDADVVAITQAWLLENLK